MSKHLFTDGVKAPDYEYHWAATFNMDARGQDVRRYRTASEAVSSYLNME